MRGDEEALFRAQHERLLRLIRRDTGAPLALVEDACCFAWLQLLRCQPEREHVVGWLRPAAREPLAEDVQRFDHTGDRPGQAIPLAERIADPRTVELTVEAREALRSLTALRWRADARLYFKRSATATRRLPRSSESPTRTRTGTSPRAGRSCEMRRKEVTGSRRSR